MLAVGVGVFMAALDGSIVNIAMPTLEKALNTEFAVVQWVILSYLLTVTTLLLGIGRLADIVGKKQIYLAGFVIFTIGSALCALAPSVGWLIGFRVLQAIGAAMIMSLGPAITTEGFPSNERGKALGIVGLAVSAGIITGPALGGLLLDQLSWHWIFLLNVPVGIVSIWISARYVPATVPPGGQRFDYGGALTLFFSLLALLLALTFGQEMGFLHPWILLLLAGWLLLLALFILIERRVSQPMLDLQLFQSSIFSVGLLSGLVSFILVAGVLFLMPFYLEYVLGYQPLIAGQLLAILPLMLGITAPVAGWLSDRVGTRLISVIGLLVLLVGYAMLSQLDAQTSTAGFILALLPIGVGMGVFQSPNNSAIMGAVPPERLGVASGLLAVSRTLGQTTGIAILGALWASRTLFHAPDSIEQGPTAAPIGAQVDGLHDTFLVVVALISLTLLLNIWLLRHKQRPAVQQAST
jgi:EmrB/QacA subfamily drug resistance transporter